MSNFKEPYYLVDFNSSICNFEIFINGMPAFTHNEGGSIASHTPINHFILKSGIQNIKINILPLKEESSLREDAFLKIKVFCYDSSTTNYEDIIEAFKYEKLDFSKSRLPIKNLNIQFNAEVKYKIEGWQNSFPLSEYLDKESFLKYCEDIYKLFKDQNIDLLYDEMKNKFNEIDTSLYLGNFDNKMELSHLLNGLNRDMFVLQEFPSSFEMKLFADKKVCSLMSFEKTSFLNYKRKETNEEFSFPIFAHKIDTKFSILR